MARTDQHGISCRESWLAACWPPVFQLPNRLRIIVDGAPRRFVEGLTFFDRPSPTLRFRQMERFFSRISLHPTDLVQLDETFGVARADTYFVRAVYEETRRGVCFDGYDCQPNPEKSDRGRRRPSGIRGERGMSTLQ